MSTATPDVIDRTVQKTNEWLNDLSAEFPPAHDKQISLMVLRAVLHALRDRLTIEEATDLGTQLPILIAGFFYEQWNPTRKPEKMNREEFLARIRAGIRPDVNIDPEGATQAVFRLLSQRVTAGEVRDLRGVLPRDLTNLWPAPVR